MAKELWSCRLAWLVALHWDFVLSLRVVLEGAGEQEASEEVLKEILKLGGLTVA